MSGFFIFLFLLSILAFIIGMVKPQTVIRWGETKTRRQVLLIYGSAVIVFFILVGITAPKLTPEQKQTKEIAAQVQSKKENKEIVQSKPSKQPDLELLESKSENDGYGSYVVGTIKNNTSKKYKYVQVEINLYDSSNVQVGSTLANVNNLEPYGTWKFKAVIFQNNTDHFKIKEITGF